MKNTLIIGGVIVLVILGYHAAAGAACLYMTTPAVINESECDTIQESGGRKWCMNLIHEPKAGPIPVTREATDPNPQKTVDGKELQ